MKIAVSSTSKIPSETANSIQVLMACQGMVENGHEVRLWVPHLKVNRFEALRRHYGLTCRAFRLYELPSLKFLHRIDFSILTILRTFFFNPTYEYTWNIQIATFAAWVGCSSIFEAHDIPSGKWGVRWFRYYIQSSTPKKVVFISHELKKRVCQIFPELKEEDCLVAPNGVNLEDYQSLPSTADAKKEMDFPDKLVVSCCGHLYAGRGTDLFLELAKRFPEASFCWFGGNAEDVANYRSKAEKLGLENVFFTGFIPKSELPLALAASDIVLMPYGREIAGSSGGNSADICSPMKMFEYMAAGKPIISSDLPVIHEVLNANTALFCEPENIESWTDGVKKLLDDPSLRESLASAAFEESKKYSWKQRQEKILSSMK